MWRRLTLKLLGNGKTESSAKENNNDSFSVVVAGTFVLCILGLFGIVYAVEGILPSPLTVSDEEKYPDAFIAERAINDLRQLTVHGPRTVGSYENEVLAVNFLKQQISVIQAEAHPNQLVEVDLQVVSGAFTNTNNSPTIKTYSNIQNIVVRVGSKTDSLHSLLINAHFDSVHVSPGGSDDGINCAVMLEILRKITKLPVRPEHNIIFLFNGAEESGLLASHGFISKHKWAKEAKVLINLEAAGHGSKAILFQSSPGESWLLSYYNHVPHSFGQTFGEELFQNNFIPSDTDFRVFRDFGNLIGYDIAFARHGYRYHTKYDDFEHIPPGSYQHVGDNALFLVKSLSNAPEMSSDKNEYQGRIVYFDFISWFMISYTETVAIVVNIITVLFSTGIFIYALIDFKMSISRHTFIYVGLTLTTIIIGWFISAAFAKFTAFILDQIKYTMSWYGNPWIIFGLYSGPIVAFTTGALVLLNHVTNKNSLSKNVKTQVQLHIIRTILALMLFIGTIMKIHSVYVILVPVIFQTCLFIIVYFLKWQHTEKKWIILYLFGTTIPTMFLMYETILISSLFIPITGRLGSDVNPEMYISAITLLMTVLVTSAYVPLITVIRQPLIFLGALCGIFLLSICLIFTPLAFPYSGDVSSPAPQRFEIYHMSRSFYDNDWNEMKINPGFLVINKDRNSPCSVEHLVLDLKNTQSIMEDCDKLLGCGLPFAHSNYMAMSNEITWIPAPQPEITKFVVSLKYEKHNVKPSVVRYKVEIVGPSQQTIFLCPVKEAKLLAISLLEYLPEKISVWNGRDVYLISHTYGKEYEQLNFYFDVEVSSQLNNVTVEIAVVGKYNEKSIFTPAYLDFLQQFPAWADITPWVAAYKTFMLT